MFNRDEARGMDDFLEESRIRQKSKKRRICKVEIAENEDRFSDLPDGILLYILSLLNTKHAVRTCVLSKRWIHLWKRIPSLTLHSSRFSTVKQFALFVSKVLALRDTSTALHALDLDRHGDIEPQLLKKILNYVSSHNAHIQELGISVRGDSSLIMSCVSSCHALTSLMLSVYPRGNVDSDAGTLFPKSLNLPALTTLDLTNFVFCGGGNGCADPFLAFKRLNSLALHDCKVSDAQILSISSETLVNLALHNNSSEFDKIELSTPSLCTFTFNGSPDQIICGCGLSSVKQANIKLIHFGALAKDALVLFSWLLDLFNIESLAVTSTTLQILSLVPDLLEVKLSSFCNLKSLQVELIPLDYGDLFILMENAMLKKAAAKSRKEAAKLRKAFKAGLEPPAIPDGIVDFLCQNSLLAEVNILSDYPGCFNLKQIEESITGAKIINYHLQSALPASSSATLDSDAESASASAAPPDLHVCRADKDDKSSNEAKVEKH